MNGYRSGAGCELCDEIAVTWCARCHCHVCPAHAGAPHCTMCAKEAKEEAEIAAFREELNVPQREERPIFPSRHQAEDTQLLAALVGWLGRLVFRPSPPEEIPFSRRSPEDIRAWRRKAGIQLRTR